MLGISGAVVRRHWCTEARRWWCGTDGQTDQARIDTDTDRQEVHRHIEKGETQRQVTSMEARVVEVQGKNRMRRSLRERKKMD